MQKKEKTARSVLIIDDNIKDIQHIKRELATLKANIIVKEATSGEEGLSILTASDARLPDIILLDVRMPRMDGFEFLRIIRSYHSFLKIKVYLMNSLHDEYDAMQAKKLGITGHFSKPFDLTGEKALKDPVKTKLKKDLGV